MGGMITEGEGCKEEDDPVASKLGRVIIDEAPTSFAGSI